MRDSPLRGAGLTPHSNRWWSRIAWVLNVYSPTGTPIFSSDFTTPWKYTGSGNWTTAVLDNTNAPWPRPFGQIEWSDYRVEFQVKDTDGNIFELFKSKEICRPAGSAKQYADTFGHVKLGLEVLCERASLYFADSTSKVYQGVLSEKPIWAILQVYNVVQYFQV